MFLHSPTWSCTSHGHESSDQGFEDIRDGVLSETEGTGLMESADPVSV